MADGGPTADGNTSAFDPALCPSGYDNNGIDASPQSRYRLISATAPVATQNADCNDDYPGWTHLVVLDSSTEGQQLRDNLTSSPFYVGAVQDRNQSRTYRGWHQFTGGSVPMIWQNFQPNDGDNFENNRENFAAADSSFNGHLNDVRGDSNLQAICECDGNPIPADIAATIAANAP